jgi:hypothetical protein
MLRRRARRLDPAPSVSIPLFHDKYTQHIGKSQSNRPHKMWKRPLTAARPWRSSRAQSTPTPGLWARIGGHTHTRHTRARTAPCTAHATPITIGSSATGDGAFPPWALRVGTGVDGVVRGGHHHHHHHHHTRHQASIILAHWCLPAVSGAAAASAQAPPRPGRGRCVSMFLDKQTLHR